MFLVQNVGTVLETVNVVEKEVYNASIERDEEVEKNFETSTSTHSIAFD